MKLLQKSPRTIPNIDFKIRGKIIKFPCFAEIKYDGWSVTVVVKNGRVWLVTGAYQREVQNIMFNGKKIQDGIYLGELMHKHGKWNTLYLISDTTFNECVVVFFDVIEFEGVDMTMKPYIERRELISHMSMGPGGWFVESQEDLDIRFEFIVKADYEGLVIKSPDETFLGQKWVKMKPKHRRTHGTTPSGN